MQTGFVLSPQEIWGMLSTLEASAEKTEQALAPLRDNYYRTRVKEIVEEHYDLGTLVYIGEIFGGTVNRNFEVRMEKNGVTTSWFFRKYIEYKEVKEILYEHHLLLHLRERGFRLTASPVRAKNGETYVPCEFGDDTSYFAIYEYLPGDDVYQWERNNVSAKTCDSVARTLAAFHAAACDYAPEEGWGNNEPIIREQLDYYWPNIKKHLEVIRQDPGNDLFTRYLDAKSEYLEDVISRLQKIFLRDDELVKTVLHTDAHPGNFKYEDDLVVGMFDFDWPKTDVRLYEVAIAAHFFACSWESHNNGEANLDLVGAFVRAYQDEMSKFKCAVPPLSPYEIEVFAEMMAIGSMYVVHFCTNKCCTVPDTNIFEYFYYTQHQLRCVEWIDEHSAEIRAVVRNACGID